jgi:hypothetical protein
MRDEESDHGGAVGRRAWSRQPIVQRRSMRSVFPKSLTRLWFGLLLKLGPYRIAIGLGSVGLLVIVRREQPEMALA